MLSITAEFDRVQSLKANIEPVAFFSNQHKRDREWDVLGATQRILKASLQEAPELAEEGLAPDFTTFLADGLPWMPIEITEAFRPDARRHQKYQKREECGRGWKSLPPPLKDPWEPLQQAITRKASMNYSSNTGLIVYFGIWLFDFQDWSLPVESQISERHRSHPFHGIDAFSRVYVLTSGMDAIVELTKARES